jgi:hypothetical protein
VSVDVESEAKPTPALYDWVCKVYNEMLAQAKEEDGQPVYTGHLTTLMRELGVPNPYYTTITKALKATNAAQQLRRGGGVAMSKWLLGETPAEEGFAEVTRRTTGKQGQVATLEQQTRDLRKLVLDQQDRLETLEGAFLALKADIQAYNSHWNLDSQHKVGS